MHRGSDGDAGASGSLDSLVLLHAIAVALRTPFCCFFGVLRSELRLQSTLAISKFSPIANGAAELMWRSTLPWYYS